MSAEATMINDLTRGSVMGKLIRFSLPIMLANTLQVAFNLVDMFFVGNYAGTDALSAVSIGGQITMLMFSFFLGIATSSQIYVAQMVGAGRKDALGDIIGNTIFMSVIAGLFLMLVIPLARPILMLMQTPDSILDIAVSYLRICCYINILIALYNGICGVLRGMGDSKHPTLFIVAATITNIVLDYVFIAKFQWGVKGAAWATIIGQSMACLCAIIFLYRKRREFGFAFRLSSIMPKASHMRILLKIGLPVTAKSLFINGSFLFVNAQINALGVVAVAVTGIAQKLQSVMNILSQAMTDSSASLVGQNFAAGKNDRVRQTFWCAMGFGSVFCVILIVLFLLFPTQIFGFFTSDPEVLVQAGSFMKVCCITMITFALMSPSIGLINGIGNTMLNMVIAFADGVAARIALSLFFGLFLGMGAVGFFLGNSLAGFVTVIWGGLYYFSGKWEKREYLK